MLEIIGAVFIIVVGCIFHFVYEWSHHNRLVGFFTAVNESTWEHLKLLIAPSYLWLAVEYIAYGNNSNFLFAHLIGLLAALIIVPAIFYSYKSIFHRDILFFDIFAFILAAIAEQVVFHLLNQLVPSPISQNLGLVGLIILFIIYLTQTYAPTKNFLSRDPITGKYGIRGHWHAQAKTKAKKPQKSHRKSRRR